MASFKKTFLQRFALLIITGIIFIFLIGKIAVVYAQTDGQSAISVNPEQVLLPISPTFFGMNLYWSTHGMESSYGGYDYADEVVGLLGELGLDTIRFPAGCSADAYKWDHNFPSPPPGNEWFSYGLSIDQYLSLTQILENDPYYTINMQEGHLNPDNCINAVEYPGTIAEARELAAYIKDRLPNKPKYYWELSNEPWGWPNWNLQDYVSRARLYAQAIKEVLPNSRFTWSWAIKGTTPNEALGEWQQMIDYLDQNSAGLFDTLQFHDYYGLFHFNVSETPLVDSWAKQRLDILQQLLANTNSQPEIDVTEFNVWCDGQNYACGTVSHLLAIAQIYRQYLLHQVSFAHLHGGIHEATSPCEYCGAHIISGGGPFWGRVNIPPEPQPIYFVQKLLADHIGAEIVSAESGVEKVDVLISKDQQVLYILVINKNNAIKALPIKINRFQLSSPARAFVIGKGSRPHSLLDLGAKNIRSGYVDVEDDLVKFYAEPYSVSVVEIDYQAGCLGDLNEDGVIGIGDLLGLLDQWGSCSSDCQADLNEDGVVAIQDLLKLLDNWGGCI